MAADDYGSITGFRWLQNNVLIVGSVRTSEELAPGAAGEYGSSTRATQGTYRALARTAWPSLTRHGFPTKQPSHTQPSHLSCRLTNGYVVTVDFNALIKLQQSHKLPDRVSAMCTTKARHRRDLGLAGREGARGY